MRVCQLFCLIIAVVFVSSPASAYELDEHNLRDHEITPLPADARFSFVQSHIAASGTYKLDRFTGDVYQILQKADGDLTWEKILRLQHPDDKQLKADSANYQLFLSGFQMKYTFLMNVRTGAIWELIQDTKTKKLFWSPIK